MYWDKILKEVVNKNKIAAQCNYANIEQKFGISSTLFSNSQKSIAIQKSKSYNLGPKYNSTYFTQREAECMVLLLQGKTVNRIADLLNLSPRTVEFYLKNMKTKLGCRTKFELIELVLESDFLKNIDLL